MPDLFYYLCGRDSLIFDRGKLYLSAREHLYGPKFVEGSFELIFEDGDWQKLFAVFDQQSVWEWEATYDDWELYGYGQTGHGTPWELMVMDGTRAVISKSNSEKSFPPGFDVFATAINTFIHSLAFVTSEGAAVQVPNLAERSLQLAMKAARGLNWQMYNNGAAADERVPDEWVLKHTFLVREARRLQKERIDSLTPARLEQKKNVALNRQPYKPLEIFSPWQQWDKPECCRKKMKFVREWFQNDFTVHASDGDGYSFFKSISQAADMWEYIGNSVVVAFVFQCSKCSKFEARVDYS